MDKTRIHLIEEMEYEEDNERPAIRVEYVYANNS